MHWTTDVNSLFEQIREMARHGNDTAVRDVMAQGTPELTETEYDNWNGGTTCYALTIHIPLHVFAAKEDELERVEAKILEWVKRLHRAETNDFVTSVLVQPGFASAQQTIPAVETPFWIPGHFRLFVSHLSADKLRATNLKLALKHFAISCFIAHEDIEPTKQWQEEIEKALSSMDGLAAILTDKFPESKWTDQEVGVALGRSVTLIPIRAGIDPYGLMGKYQGIPAVGRTVSEVAQAVVSALLMHAKSRVQYIPCLVEQLLAATDKASADAKMDVLEKTNEIGSEQLTRIQENTAANAILYDDAAVLSRINKLLSRHGMDPVKRKQASAPPPSGDIPF